MSRPKPVSPPNWKVFSWHICFEVADWQCQCLGECAAQALHPEGRRCVEQDGLPARHAKGTIALTVVPVCHCPFPCMIESHVKAYCPRCLAHLPRSQQAAAETRRRAKEAQGQLTFLP